MKKLLGVSLLLIMVFAYQSGLEQHHSAKNLHPLNLLFQKEKDPTQKAAFSLPSDQSSPQGLENQNLQMTFVNQMPQQASMIMVSVLALLVLGLASIYQLFRRKPHVKNYVTQLGNIGQPHRLSTSESFKEAQENEPRNKVHKIHEKVDGILSIGRLNFKQFELEVFPPNSNTAKKLPTPQEQLIDINGTLPRINPMKMPVELESGELKQTILDLLASIHAAHKIKVEEMIIGLSDTEAWPQNVCLSFYRIIQEALNNLIKHSTATHVLVQIIEQKKSMTVYVEYNGKILKHIENQDELELKLLENIAFLKGTVEFDRTEKQRNFILIELPPLSN